VGARLAIAGVLVLLVLGIAYWSTPRLFQPSAPPAKAVATSHAVATPEAPPARSRTIRITAVTGEVERQRGGGPGIPVHVGDELQPDEVVRTLDGSAALSVGELADVQIAPRTAVALGALSDTLSHLKLADGRISAIVHGRPDQGLEVEVPGAEAVATSKAGEFSMLAQGGQVAVATRRGEVRLTAHEKSVVIGAGQLSIVEGAKPPSAPVAIPASLFLKLGRLNATVQREKETTVQGTTTPGAVVSINGVRVPAGPNGEFSATVPLAEGPNKLAVTSEDALGRQRKAVLPRITVDTRAPDLRSKVKW
jgi:hypothetical protein